MSCDAVNYTEDEKRKCQQALVAALCFIGIFLLILGAAIYDILKRWYDTI